MRSGFLLRTRKFTPRSFFLSVLHLSAATNNEGYSTAMHRAWQKSGLKLTSTPSKSSLSEFRKKVSSDFFREIFEDDLTRFLAERQTFRKFIVYAVDGDHLDLPATDDVIAHGYRGWPIGKSDETHCPKMYTVQAVDLLNGVVARFSCSNKVSEISQAHKMIGSFEKNSITIYDRLHQNYEMAAAHADAGNYFFVRVRQKSSSLNVEIKAFCKSKRRAGWIDVEAPDTLHTDTRSLRLRLIKVKNKRTKEDVIFMTNMPEGLIKNKEAGALYQRRWGIESSFKDLTDTLKMGQWHSKKLNGIMQEIYALLWLVNNVRRAAAALTENTREWLAPSYKKANFKMTVVILVDHLELLIKGKYRKLRRILDYWIKRGAENRKHMSRSYPRQVKRFGKKYPNVSRIDRRPAA